MCPPASVGHSCTLDGNGLLVLIGGGDAAKVHADLFLLQAEQFCGAVCKARSSVPAADRSVSRIPSTEFTPPGSPTSKPRAAPILDGEVHLKEQLAAGLQVQKLACIALVQV